MLQQSTSTNCSSSPHYWEQVVSPHTSSWHSIKWVAVNTYCCSLCTEDTWDSCCMTHKLDVQHAFTLLAIVWTKHQLFLSLCWGHTRFMRSKQRRLQVMYGRSGYSQWHVSSSVVADVDTNSEGDGCLKCYYLDIVTLCVIVLYVTHNGYHLNCCYIKYNSHKIKTTNATHHESTPPCRTHDTLKLIASILTGVVLLI